ncbi:hypothetical protein DL89DRAFT_266779 [Linderina pennispora]|uniref:Uncharacterized protein n=1 Tax=Linderina pennispora TaxID=61395 RepID=A0A1Y1WBQ3_9FUNG|nr:uncharacterized protein DL89DRAFT_266779 [Linderina pennispora]ORX70584.1 hypothetical protein DL89DRAFT_266779 [Linderina pennispora]
MAFAMRSSLSGSLNLPRIGSPSSLRYLRAADTRIPLTQSIRYQILRLANTGQAWQRHSPVDKRWLHTITHTLGGIAGKGRLARSYAAYSTESKSPSEEHHEKVLTIPNALTMARILSSPNDMVLALTGCVVFGLTDALDGYIAPADKVLMTTLTVALAYGGLLPTALAAVIIGRDLALSLAAFFIRWTTLPAPKTLKRYFDLSIPSVEVRPTQISKWNTALQLGSPGTTTVLSGIGYLTSKDAQSDIPKPPHILPTKKQQK